MGRAPEKTAQFRAEKRRNSEGLPYPSIVKTTGFVNLRPGGTRSHTRLREKEPAWPSVIALPAFSRYRDLYAETQGSLAAAHIEV